MHFVWLRSTSLRVFKFVKIKEGGSNFWGEPILQNVWIIWCPLVYFNFKSFSYPHSASFISFKCILYDSGVLLSGFWSFYKLRRGDLISRGEPILQNVWIIWSPLLYFSFKSFLDPNSLPFIGFQMHFVWFRGTSVRVSKFLQVKEGDLISAGNQFCRMSELFGHPFCISILKVLWTQLPRHSLDFSPLCMNDEDFSQSPEISTN